MTRFARWVVVVTVYGAVFGTAGEAVGESAAPFDSGTCFGSQSCACGYVCVSGYCAYRGADDAPAECESDTDCRPECADRVCVARRCVARSSVDDSGTGIVPPRDRPPTGEDRLVDATMARDDGPPPDGNAEAPWDRPTVARDVPPPPLDRDAGAVDIPTVATDSGSAATDAEPADGSADPEPTGTVVQGCGCAVTGATTVRPWWALGLVAWGLRRRRRSGVAR
ncbi:MAG: MYXO-CTERM sorting domain-containing protein [Deltaproteobacteria bacterium]|nr:MYXO-CTERM sorting domain-containing protein [Myxococcales bacterium]MDP3216318.1 MYXO-CTERM sorting domain-containing protein [Deltaproteobacteria bacterium]